MRLRHARFAVDWVRLTAARRTSYGGATRLLATPYFATHSSPM